MESTRSCNLRLSIDAYRDYVTEEENSDVKTLRNCDSILQSFCGPINEAKLKEYDDLEEKDWKLLLRELNNSLIKSDPEKVKEDITKKYGKYKRNALMSILVCHPPLDVVKFLVKEGGDDTVTEVGGCGFNSLHYACWGNASLDVITYLLDIGGEKALLEKSINAGANPLHYACIRYKSTESNSFSDLIRLLIKVGGQNVVTATDFNDEIPLQGLLLHSNPPVDAIVTYLDEWYTLKKPGEALIPSQGPMSPHTSDGEGEHFNDDQMHMERLNGALNDSFNKMIRQLLKTHSDVQSQILKTQFMKEYLVERFIEPLPLAILMMDLYIQAMIVCVFSLLINPYSPNPVNSAAIKSILVVCVIWRLFRELRQLMATPFGAYLSNISNWFDIAQIVLLILTLRMNLDANISSSSHLVLSIATFYSWFELLLEIHNFQHDLALFVAALIKIVTRLWSFLFTTLIFIAMFAHTYYIAGPNDAEICNDGAMKSTDDDFLAGGFVCTRPTSYQHSFFNILTFENPSGVPQWIPYFYSIVMLVLLLNIIIAVVCTEYEDVLNESELAFWSDRLVIVNELGDLCASLFSFSSTSTSLSRSIYEKVKGWCKTLLPVFYKPPNKRIDLNLFLDNSVWDGMSKEINILHWWYGKSDEKKDKPKLVARLKFFITYSALKDIIIPTNVFENMILGRKRSYRSDSYEKLQVLPVSVILIVTSNVLLAIVFILGLLSFGVLWPDTMKKRLFSVKKKQMIAREVTKSSKDIDMTREDISKMNIENNNMRREMSEVKSENKEMRKEITCEVMKGGEEIGITRKDISKITIEISEMKKEIQKILSGINSLTRD